MDVQKLPVPTLGNMDEYFGGIRKERNYWLGRGCHTLTIVLRHNDTELDKPASIEDEVFKEITFGTYSPAKECFVPIFKKLVNLTCYIVVDKGIFYAKRDKGLFYWHQSGNGYCVSRTPNIFDIQFQNGILTAYIYKGLQQTASNEHRDINGGYDEEWYDAYNILSNSEKYQYEEILKYVENKELQDRLKEKDEANIKASKKVLSKEELMLFAQKLVNDTMAEMKVSMQKITKEDYSKVIAFAKQELKKVDIDMMGSMDLSPIVQAVADEINKRV